MDTRQGTGAAGPAPSGTGEAQDPLERIRAGTAWDDFCDALREAGDAILRPGSPRDDFDRAEGYRYLSRLTRLALEKYVEFNDPLVPELYRLSHETAKIGVDNPDSAYLNATISGSHEYRIRGRRGSEPYLSFAVYFGHYGDAGRSGCSGYLEWDDIEAEPDGSFELVLSQKEQPKNWLRLEPESHLLVIRRNHLDRENETPTEVTIELLDVPAGQGRSGQKQPLDPVQLSENLMAAARYVAGTAHTFCDWAEDWAQHPNTIRPLDDAVKESTHGDRNFRMLFGYWELGPDEALVVDIEPPECEYWNLELCNHWLESLDYRYHRIHVNKHTAHYDAKGRARVVIAHRDPGLPNWLDTAGHARGTIGMRWGKASSHPVPECRVVRFDELAGASGKKRGGITRGGTAMRLLKGIGIAFGVLALVIAGLAVGSRFADGPLVEMLPGGPLEAGPLVSAPVADWSFAAAVDKIELESAGRSRWVWVLVEDGQAYVPCSLAIPFKRWHEQALEDPAGVVRVEGGRYPVRLDRVDDAALEERLERAIASKYASPLPADAETWFFRLSPRAAGG